MSTAAVNTKIERLVEAIEDFAIAIAHGIARPGPSDEGPIRNYERVREHRQDVADALREFLQPTLRVVSVCEHGTPPGSNCCAQSSNWPG